MPPLGPPELIIILLLVVIVFGVGKLPEVGGALGKSIKEFRRHSEDPDAQAKREAESRPAAVQKSSDVDVEAEVQRRVAAELAAREPARKD